MKLISFIKETFVDVARAVTSKEGMKTLFGVSLYRNASYLMINSGVTAALGFIFWIVVARLYPPSDVGLGSALISAAMFLSFIGTLGLGFGIIRFLPNSSDKTRLLNSSFFISLLASVAVALAFLAGLHLWSPKLTFVWESPVFLAVFIAFVAVGALSNILDQSFIGFRRVGFALARGTIFSILKIVLVAALAAVFKVFGIFASWGLAIAVSVPISLFLFLPKVLPSYRPLLSLQRQVSNEMIHFSFTNYIGQALQGASGWILPLMVVNILGAEANAYFYVTWAMTGLLMAIPMATSMSFFAEGSHEEEKLGDNLRKSLKLIVLLLIPAIVIMVLLGDRLLLLFGRQYSEEATHLLWFLSLAALPGSINFLYLGIARVEKKLREILLVTGTIAFGTLFLSYLFVPHLGILGAGVGWLATQTTVALGLLLILGKRLGFGR